MLWKGILQDALNPKLQQDYLGSSKGSLRRMRDERNGNIRKRRRPVPSGGRFFSQKERFCIVFVDPESCSRIWAEISLWRDIIQNPMVAQYCAGTFSSDSSFSMFVSRFAS